MDIPKSNLETAAGRKSLATKVPPNKDKETFDWFDDTMPSVDDWMDYDVDDEDKTEGDQSDTAKSPPEAVTVVPPKDDRPSSAVSLASPKNKKTKFPNFDEILQNLNFDILSLKFTKLLLFLESDNKELALPFSLKEYEEFFKIIVKDINVLKSKSLDASYRLVCDNIIKAATGYSLTCVYEYKTDFKKIVMVIRKEKNNNMIDQSVKETRSFLWSEECTKSSSQTSSETDTKELSRSSPASTLSSGFKLHCLHTMLAFIKYDETKSKEIPGLSPDQAHYMQSLLRYNARAFNDFEKNVEVKDLHRALWEAMKNYSLKYEFKITCEDSSAGKKNLSFEKIPKPKCSIPIFETDSNHIMNPTIEFKKSEMSNSEMPRSEIQKPESPMPDVAKPWFAKPEVPKSVPVQQINPCMTKKMLKKKIKEENETLLIKSQTTQFVANALNSFLEFLLDDEQQQLVFVPKTSIQLRFYRKVIKWCRAEYSVSKFGEDFEKLHSQIQTQLSQMNVTASFSKCNATTGLKNMTYIKVQNKNKRFGRGSAQSTPKKKVNLQNVLELAGTEQIQLASVVDLNQSLRNKKKNKKQKKAKLNKANAIASKEASSNLSDKGSTDSSSSSCSSRATSRDRATVVPKAQQVGKRGVKEIPREEDTRKEQLLEALSVPVQSDKAMRMMRGMGWNGGALGARGDGIIEPLMPKLDLPRGAGLGHTRNSRPRTTSTRPKVTETTSSWVSITEAIEKMQNEFKVNKTELLPEKSTLDSINKTVDQPQRSNSIVELSKSSDSNVELSKSSASNVELSKSSTSNVELSKLNVVLPAQSKSDVELLKPETPFTYLGVSQNFSRLEYLHSIYELLNSDSTFKILKYQNVIPVKARRFVTKVIHLINKREIDYAIFLNEEFSIYTQICKFLVKCKNSPQIFIDAALLYDTKTIELKKSPPDRQNTTKLNMPSESVIPLQPGLWNYSPETNAEVITEAQIRSYIVSSKSECGSPRAFAHLKFKVLFLFNIRNFVKSLNEEVEVTFNKVLSSKEKSYIKNVVDEVNMRIHFGSSPAENQLSSEIMEHVKDAFLGAMFNHQYTVVTLNKYFRFKRLNRPDNAVKRKCQTTVNLDIYQSKTVSQAKVNIYEPTDTENDNKDAENYNFADDVAKNHNKLDENYSKVDQTNSTVAGNNNKVAENNNYIEVLLESSDDDITNPYDSDESSVEEYDNNNATAKVPGLPPGEENVNISNFLCLYDKDKPSKSRAKNNNDNDSASNMTAKNINNKNNIGNGNVVIDNNDNQIIDMKRDGNFKTTDIRMDEEENDDFDSDAEYYVCEMSVDIGKEEEEEVNITENKRAGFNEQQNKDFDIAATNDGRLVNQHENVSIDHFDEIIDKDLSHDNTDIEDIDSHNDCWEDIVTDEINDIPENLYKNNDIKDQNVIMKENVTEIMEVISITEKEDLVKVTNKDSLEVVETSINLSADQNVRQETKNVDIMTDCDILKEENIVLSGKNCDTQSVVLKVGTEINVPNFAQDMDSEIKTVRIVHSCHPLVKITKEKVTEIQKHISKAIMLTIELPLLKCQGVQSDALVYTCHNKKTYDWLLNTISAASNVKVLNTRKVTKMALKFYCFFDYSSSLYLFKMIELYNRVLSTENWVVEKTEKEGDYVIFIVKMDKFSIKFIQESGLSLFAGVDKVQFSPIWE